MVYEMARRRQRRRSEKEQRHASPPAVPLSARDVQLADRVERLAYTREQAAKALGVSLATLDRRVVPSIATVKTEWGTRLIPVDELEHYLGQRRQEGRMRPRQRRRGRKPGLPPEVIARIRGERGGGDTFVEIARGLNADRVQTSQGGRQWWPSTVRAVLVRQSPAGSAQSSNGHV